MTTSLTYEDVKRAVGDLVKEHNRKPEDPPQGKTGLALLFDKQQERHYRHTCACGTSVRVNRKPKETCLKCGQVMSTSLVQPRGDAMHK